MSDVRRLLKKQKTERSKAKKITHPFAKYDDMARLICVVCNNIVKSENVWQAHLGSGQHRDNISKLKALKEEQQQRKRAAPSSEQPAPKRAKPLLTQYDDDDSDEMEDDTEEKQQIEEEEEEDSALPADFFDKNEDDMEEVEEEEEASPEESNTLPAGFFDDPEEDARVHGSIAPSEQAELDLEQGMEEFKDVMVEATKEAEEIQDEDDELFWQERNEDLFREQAELDSRVEKLKQMRQNGHVENIEKQRQVDDISVGLKQSVRQVLKSTSVKKVTTMFDDMDEDSSSEEEEEEEEDEDWRAQQLS
ncbi:hypothetical protein K501DRAFT_282265 [Backusella circina FSU 941]|nr:hypothetical protein K501DRAFT_282265 [Backusella circina FSU 941]